METDEQRIQRLYSDVLTPANSLAGVHWCRNDFIADEDVFILAAVGDGQTRLQRQSIGYLIFKHPVYMRLPEWLAPYAIFHVSEGPSRGLVTVSIQTKYGKFEIHCTSIAFVPVEE